jgi:rhodanese-related sulfurtransferase
MSTLMAAHFLQECGFTNVVNLEDGMRAWSDQVDPSIEQY